MQIVWNKCEGDAWGWLSTVNLAHTYFDGREGGYVIWHGGQNPRTVRVGQGVIRDRLTAQREDPEIQAYEGQGLFVTWARINAGSRNGVEAYLANQLNPLVGERFPDVTPVQVNLPW